MVIQPNIYTAECPLSHGETKTIYPTDEPTFANREIMPYCGTTLCKLAGIDVRIDIHSAIQIYDHISIRKVIRIAIGPPHY